MPLRAPNHGAGLGGARRFSISGGKREGKGADCLAEPVRGVGGKRAPIGEEEGEVGLRNAGLGRERGLGDLAGLDEGVGVCPQTLDLGPEGHDCMI